MLDLNILCTSPVAVSSLRNIFFHISADRPHVFLLPSLLQASLALHQGWECNLAHSHTALSAFCSEGFQHEELVWFSPLWWYTGLFSLFLQCVHDTAVPQETGFKKNHICPFTLIVGLKGSNKAYSKINFFWLKVALLHSSNENKIPHFTKILLHCHEYPITLSRIRWWCSMVSSLLMGNHPA